ncbi:MAG TPA: protein kinase [Candidatus Sulfotelmatobacter sp.]|nr:protein kinase [Candidatus Sulfotelmatobacter sp.]
MNPTREEALFALALEKSPAERAAWLDRECGDDKALRQRLEVLLAAHEQSQGVLAEPAVKATMKIEFADVPDEAVGQKIGRYKILEKIGEGGCGVVYVAEQTEPVRRRVALKVIKLGMDTKQVVARFEAERQALAMMDHPNIAKVLDAGTTETGRPYFVMELVRGIKLTDYCDQNKMPTKERLDLFIKICQAIQHAHQKGIIHRDIKPSNILVTLHDSVPVPKVIDFGIAKATEGRLTDATVYTQLHQFIGTPAYMSPEQAEMSGLDIDTRSDIYSLGVLLYELLTSRTPFDAKELMSLGLDLMRQTIREKEPLRPSTKVATLQHEELSTTAMRRAAEAPKLISMLRGDLDWIVMKCLEKDRTRRYETANGLASDLKRHLNNEPVTACPPSAAYKFQKAFHRNKLAFTACFAVAAALLLGIIATTLQSVRAIHAKRQAQAAEAQAIRAQANETKQRQAAELAAKKSQEVLNFMQSMFGKAGDSYADRVTVLEMLNKGVADVDQQFQNEPDVLASIQYSAGYCYSKIGQWDKARYYLQKAAKLRSQLLGYENPETLVTLRELASVALSQGQNEEAEALCNKIVSSAQAGLTNNQLAAAQKSELRHIELTAYGKLEQQYLEEGQLSKADVLNEEMLEAVRTKELTGLDVVYVWDDTGTLALEQGHPREAIKAFESALTYYHATGVQFAWDEGLQGEAYLALGDYPKAETLITNSLPILLRRFGESHFEVQRDIRALMSLYSKMNRPDLEEEWKARLDKLNQEENEMKSQTVPVNELQNADSLAKSTHELLIMGMFAEAESLARECLGLREKDMPDDWRTFDAQSMLGGSLLGQKKYSDAGPLLLSGYKGLKQRENQMTATDRNICLKESLGWLVQFYQASDQTEKPTNSMSPQDLFAAATTLETLSPPDLDNWSNAVVLLEKAVTATSRTNVIYLTELAAAYGQVGQVDKAIAMEREAIASLSANNSDDFNEVAWTLATSPFPKMRNGSNAVVFAEKAVDETGHTNANIMDTLAAAYAEAGQFAKAAATEKEAVALLANADQKQDFAGRESLYKSSIPYRGLIALSENTESLLQAGKLTQAGLKFQVQLLDDGTWDATLNNQPISDLSVLRGAPISTLWLQSTAVSDLTPLRGMPLKRLAFTGTEVSDLSPLTGMKLIYLNIAGTPVSDLSPLRGMPLIDLRMSGCANIIDLSPLAGMETLRSLELPPNVTNIDLLRGLTNLTRIGFKYDPAINGPDKTVAQFWADYDKSQTNN